MTADHVAALAEVLEGHREEPHTYSWPDKTRGPRCSCKHAKWGPQHLAAEIAASPAMRDLLAGVWDEGWDEYDNYAGGTGEPEPPRENPYREAQP